MKIVATIVSYILCAIASVLWWRVHVIQFGMVSVRHFTPEQVAWIHTGAVITTILFAASFYMIHRKGGQ